MVGVVGGVKGGGRGRRYSPSQTYLVIKHTFRILKQTLLYSLHACMQALLYSLHKCM